MLHVYIPVCSFRDLFSIYVIHVGINGLPVSHCYNMANINGSLPFGGCLFIPLFFHKCLRRLLLLLLLLQLFLLPLLLLLLLSILFLLLIASSMCKLTYMSNNACPSFFFFLTIASATRDSLTKIVKSPRVSFPNFLMCLYPSNLHVSHSPGRLPFMT